MHEAHHRRCGACRYSYATGGSSVNEHWQVWTPSPCSAYPRVRSIQSPSLVINCMCCMCAEPHAPGRQHYDHIRRARRRTEQQRVSLRSFSHTTISLLHACSLVALPTNDSDLPHYSIIRVLRTPGSTPRRPARNTTP